MTNPLADYLIDQQGIDWSQVLATWSWLLPPEFELWLVTRFADLFLVLPDGTVSMLDVGTGTLEQVAVNRNDFREKFDDDQASHWLMIPLVDQLVTAGVTLRPGQCYAFKNLPLLGGDYTTDNVAPISISDYLGPCGTIHEQLKDVPDGTAVRLKAINLQNKTGDS